MAHRAPRTRKNRGGRKPTPNVAREPSGRISRSALDALPPAAIQRRLDATGQETACLEHPVDVLAAQGDLDDDPHRASVLKSAAARVWQSYLRVWGRPCARAADLGYSTAPSSDDPKHRDPDAADLLTPDQRAELAEMNWKRLETCLRAEGSDVRATVLRHCVHLEAVPNGAGRSSAIQRLRRGLLAVTRTPPVIWTDVAAETLKPC